MNGDGKYLVFLVLVGGLIFEVAGLPAMSSTIAAVAGWFKEIPDLHPNISKLIGEISWPAAILIIVILFREEVTRILRSIKRLTWGDKSIDLSDDLDAIERKVSRSGLAFEVNNLGVDEKFVRLIEHAPAAAILESWKELENILREIAARFDLEGSKFVGTRRLIDLLWRREWIDESERFVLVGLANIRNKAVHTDDVSRADAYRFLENAQIAKDTLNRIVAIQHF